MVDSHSPLLLANNVSITVCGESADNYRLAIIGKVHAPTLQKLV